ncbi:hypothetical protein [Mesorhizobium wenxiniae]|nr:hypothetical protein [Mesorhizobium wenxiniae]
MQFMAYNSIFPDALDSCDLRDIGNVDTIRDQFGEIYGFVRRRAEPAGLLLHAGMALKIYHMIRDDRPLQQGTAEGLEEFICKEIDRGNVDCKQHIGFAILGQGFLSISCWGKGNGLYVQTYSVEDSYPNLTRKTLEKTAVACTWDSRIMFHEVLAWHEYLKTSRTHAHKVAYLSNMVSGYLDEAPNVSLPDPNAFVSFDRVIQDR